jgi:hypothetical protein
MSTTRGFLANCEPPVSNLIFVPRIPDPVQSPGAPRVARLRFYALHVPTDAQTQFSRAERLCITYCRYETTGSVRKLYRCTFPAEQSSSCSLRTPTRYSTWLSSAPSQRLPAQLSSTRPPSAERACPRPMLRLVPPSPCPTRFPFRSCRSPLRA